MTTAANPLGIHCVECSVDAPCSRCAEQIEAEETACAHAGWPTCTELRHRAPCECCGRSDVPVGVHPAEDDDAVMLCDECVRMLREMQESPAP